MKDLLCDQFQDAVGETLIRHRSIMDIMAKFQESNARVNRAISKAVTNCGCIKIEAEKQQIPLEISLRDLRNYMSSHTQGQLCEHCKDIIETELGNNLFYLAAVCNLFDLNIYDIILKEHKKMNALGVFHFS
jgi:hypothetical protein